MKKVRKKVIKILVQDKRVFLKKGKGEAKAKEVIKIIMPDNRGLKQRKLVKKGRQNNRPGEQEESSKRENKQKRSSKSLSGLPIFGLKGDEIGNILPPKNFTGPIQSRSHGYQPVPEEGYKK